VASLFNYCLSILHRSAWLLYFKLVSFEVLDSMSKWLPNCTPTGPHSGLNCAKLKSSTECSKLPCHVIGWEATTKHPAVISVVASSTADCKWTEHFCYNYNSCTASDVVSKVVGEASSINIWIKACIILEGINLMWICAKCVLYHVLFNHQKELCKCIESGRKDNWKKLQN